MAAHLVAPELDNVRSVLAWSLEHDPESGLEVAAALEAFWVVREPTEGAAWLGRLLDAAANGDELLRAGGLLALAGTLDIFGDHDGAARHYAESLAIVERVGSLLQTATIHFRVAANLINRGDADGVAPAMLERSLEDARALGSRTLEAEALSYLSRCAWRDGEHDRAVELMGASATIVHDLGWTWWECGCEASLAEFERERGRLDAAESHARAALTLALALEDRMSAVFSVAELALQAVERGDAGTAGRLWGAIEAEEASAPIGQWPRVRGEVETKVLSVDGPEFKRAREEGRLLTLSAAADLPEPVPQTDP